MGAAIRGYDNPRSTAAVFALAVMVMLAQPVASLAWLAGAHATPAQATLHDEAVEHGSSPHHGARHDHQRLCDACTNTTGVVLSGPVFGPAEMHWGFFKDTLKATFVALLDLPARSAKPYDVLRTEAVPTEHFPKVPHRPPIPSRYA